jgi:uncharacterized MAPEG superfamily protein
MSIELSVLAWGCVLALLHIIVATQAKTRQYGRAWNVGPRDAEMPPPTPLVARLARAQANYFETFPIMAAAILVVTLASLESYWTAVGALLWLVARLVYVPLYALAVPLVRSLAWIVAAVGILMVLWPALRVSLQLL